MSYKCALVPDRFFEPSKARAILVQTADVDEGETVAHVAVPYYNAVLVYVRPDGEDGVPELYRLLEAAHGMEEHNRIAASCRDGRLFLVVARDDRLLLCNSFEAGDFTTAQYFIFLALSRFQLNPEVSSIFFLSPLDPEQELSLRRYFRKVVRL